LESAKIIEIGAVVH